MISILIGDANGGGPKILLGDIKIRLITNLRTCNGFNMFFFEFENCINDYCR